MTITISGGFGDGVRVVGEVPGCGEYPACNCTLFVELSTGDVLGVKQSPSGRWCVGRYRWLNHDAISTVRCEPTDCSEVVRVHGAFAWVEVWGHWPPAADELCERIAELSDVLPEMTAAELRPVWEGFAAAKRRMTG